MNIKSNILSLEKLKNEAMEEKSAMDEMVTLATSSESEECYNKIGLQCDFEFEPTASSFQTSNAQKRRKIVNTRITEQNEMPARYQHLRESIRKVKTGSV